MARHISFGPMILTAAILAVPVLVQTMRGGGPPGTNLPAAARLGSGTVSDIRGDLPVNRIIGAAVHDEGYEILGTIRAVVTSGDQEAVAVLAVGDRHASGTKLVS